MNRYALFDWDNTLRKGFTIVSWMDYLHSHHMVDKADYLKLLHQFELYKSNQISYQQLSDNSTLVYVQATMGMKVADLEELACDFCLHDQDIFPFTRPLLNTLCKKDIKLIVISGSPQIVLSQYARMLGISEIFGMDVEVKSNVYTGVLKKDYGIEKSKIVYDICRSQKSRPLFSFGDSIADKPLLDAAKYGFLIDEKNGQFHLNNHISGTVSTIDETVEHLCATG